MPRDPFYTARAHVTGGREHGHGRTSDGLLDVQLRAAPELGGDGGGTNPEQLFAVGYAACFEGALMVAARRERLAVDDVAIDSQVSLTATDDRRFVLGVVLEVTLPSVEDPEQAKALVEAAHRICPYSNATRGNIDVTLTANGQPVLSNS
jgi:Ohr subfamily peroxiredoxin